MRWIAVLAVACASISRAQTSFEVASVKPAQRKSVGCSGGPGTTDPGIWRCSNVGLSNLISLAYGLQRYQFKPLDWISDSRYDVVARVGPGSTRNSSGDAAGPDRQRFHLGFHFDGRRCRYSRFRWRMRGLSRKNRRSHPSFSPPPRPSYLPLPVPLSSWDFVSGPVSALDSRRSLERHQVSLKAITLDHRTLNCGVPVGDATGLEGRYDLALSSYQERNIEVVDARGGMGETVMTAEGGPTFPRRMKAQLGLKVEVKMGISL